MNEREVHLPSGLSGFMKPWTVGDLSVFGDRRIFKKPGPAIEAELLKRSWVRTIENGPYDFEGRPKWNHDVLQGDITAAMLQARIISLGTELDITFRCSSCRAKIETVIPLDKLPIIGLSDEARAVFSAGNRFEFTLPECGKSVEYCLPTGKSIIRAERFERDYGRGWHVVLASRLEKIEGVTSRGHFVDFVSNLSPIDGRALSDEMERFNCGVDTDIELYCDECDEEQVQAFSFGPDFFAITGSKKAKKSEE